MIRLLKIEWYKLKTQKAFWILFGLYSLCVTLICSGGIFFLRFLKKQGADFRGLDPTIVPIYDFPDIWQNVAYVAKFFNVFLGFIIIISIVNEIQYRTLRQNVIDGLSKREFLLSKFLFICVIAAASTVLVFLISIICGLIFSSSGTRELIFTNTGFLRASFFSVVCYMSFAMTIALLIRKTGLVIVGLLIYSWFVEPITFMIFQEAPFVSEGLRPIRNFFPVMAINNLVPLPFPKYILMEVQDYLKFSQFAIAGGWLTLNLLISYWLLKRKDW